MPTFVPSPVSYGQTSSTYASYSPEQLEGMALGTAKDSYYEAKKKYAQKVYKYKACKSRREAKGKKAYPEDPGTSWTGSNCYGDWKNRKDWKDRLRSRAIKYFDLLQEQDKMTDKLYQELSEVLSPPDDAVSLEDAKLTPGVGRCKVAPGERLPPGAVEKRRLTILGHCVYVDRSGHVVRSKSPSRVDQAVDALLDEADRDRRRRRGNRHRPTRRQGAGLQVKDIPLPRATVMEAQQVDGQLAAVPDAPSAISDAEANAAIAVGDTGEGGSVLTSPLVLGTAAVLAAGTAYYFFFRRD